MMPPCTRCGDADVVALTPGSEPVWAPGAIPITHGRPVVAWCRDCWRAAFYAWEAREQTLLKTPCALSSNIEQVTT